MDDDKVRDVLREVYPQGGMGGGLNVPTKEAQTLARMVVERDERIENWRQLVAETFGTDITDELVSLRARIAELEAAARWVPVGERLPTVEDGDIEVYGPEFLFVVDAETARQSHEDDTIEGCFGGLEWTHWRKPDPPTED